MIRSIPFGNAAGFGEGKRQDEHYYSQNMQSAPDGLTTGYLMTVLDDSTSISGLANVKYFADRVGTMYAVDSAGKIYAEATPGVGNFGAAIRNPGGTGRGLIGDQKGRLLYFQNTQIGKLEGASTFTDNWKTGLEDTEHHADTYEDLVVFTNGNKIGVIYSDDSDALDAFELPSSFTTACVRGGSLGVLIGANLGYSGYVILWNPIYDRSAAPWIPLSGQVQSIERTDGGWIVTTTKGILWTNGYSTRPLFPLLDDPLGALQYTVAPQGTLLVNNKLFMLNQTARNTRRKAGVYIFDLETNLFAFAPVSTNNTNSVTPLAIAVSKTSSQNILIGYEDTKTGAKYISSISDGSGTRGMFISEPIGQGTTEMAAEAIILNVGPYLGRRNSALFTFDVSVKLYDFKRAIWGIESTTALAGAANLLRVNGSTPNVDAQVGDEVTVLEGPNAGEVRQIASIASEGTANEEWTMDRAFSNATASNVQLQVEPYQLIERKTFENESEIPELYFNCTEKQRGKKFALKVLIENSSHKLTLHPSTFIYDDLGHTT